ncbi:minor tail protein [Gordonia phage Archimedes]|uniref:Minor tail protein n=1 Tax=Gordonia phage Archimedes TaxID=2759389 RepID=A0A7L7STB3_9CAUD|nr:minor tail protein [Gordonia phage Archimedes]QOC55725.1 minor tail protein [Gordonia phage Archimedes]
MVRRFYFPPPATPENDTFGNAEELAKYLATGADLGPLRGFINALLKTLQGDLTAIPEWIEEQTGDWLDDFSDWFLNLGASFNDLMKAFEGVYDGDDVALLAIQSVINTIKSLAGGLIDLSRLPSVPLGSLTLTQPNLLLNPEFDGAISMDGEGVWFWDEAMGRTTPGSARATGDGTRKVLTSNAVQTGPDEDFETAVWVRWDGATGTGQLYRLVVSAYQGDLKLADTVIGAITSPASSATWTKIAGDYTTPANTDHVRVYLECTTNATGGNVWFDDAELRKTATSLPMEWIKDLLPQLGGLWDNLEALVNNALSALGIIGSGSLLDRILDLADEFGDMLGGIEDGAANFTNLIDQLLHDPASLLGQLPQNLVNGLSDALNSIRNQVLSVIKNVIQGIRGVPFVGDNIADALLAMLNEVAGLQNTAITAKTTAVQAQLDASAALANIAELKAAAIATQAWVSNLNDVVSVPRALLIPQVTGTGSVTVSGTTGSGGTTTAGPHTHSFNDGAHSHTIQKALPSYKPTANNVAGNSTGSAYFTPIVSDRNGTARKLRFITGPDSLVFSIDEYWLGLYSFDVSSRTLSRIWLSSNLKNSIGDDRAEVEVAIPNIPVVPASIVFVGHMQRQPSLGGSTRNVAAVPQGGVSRPSSVLLRASCYALGGLTAMPTSVNLDDMSMINDFIPWYALSVDS